MKSVKVKDCFFRKSTVEVKDLKQKKTTVQDLETAFINPNQLTEPEESPSSLPDSIFIHRSCILYGI